MAKNREILQEALAQAEWDVARGEYLIARQQQIVAKLERDGHDAEVGRKLLKRLEDMQATHITDRDRIRDVLKGST
jgi:hypothetical protein